MSREQFEQRKAPNPDLPINNRAQFKPQPRFEEQEEEKQPQNIDEMPLPAMKKGKKSEFDDEGGGITGGPSGGSVAEELTGDSVKLAEPLIPVFGEETMKKLFSRKAWQLREEALRECEQAIRSGRLLDEFDDESLFIATTGVASYGISDKIANVNAGAM